MKAFKKYLDREIVRRMIAKLEEADELEDPTDMAKPMAGNLTGPWLHRIGGGYRVIADVQCRPTVSLIFAVEAGSRRDVYER